MRPLLHGISRIISSTLWMGGLLWVSGCGESHETAASQSAQGIPPLAAPSESSLVDGQQHSAGEPAADRQVLVDATQQGEALDPYLGVWRLEYQGTRTITIRPDGTASMLVQLDFLGSLIYGNQLSLDLTWSVGEGVLSYVVHGGSPTASAERVMANYGREFRYRIVELTEARILLEDLNSPGTTYDWTRLSPSTDIVGRQFANER